VNGLIQVAALSPEVFRVEVETESRRGERDSGALGDGAHLERDPASGAVPRVVRGWALA
jgi:hypothetical protein